MKDYINVQITEATVNNIKLYRVYANGVIEASFPREIDAIKYAEDRYSVSAKASPHTGTPMAAWKKAP
jgi:hypothetical protein